MTYLKRVLQSYEQSHCIFCGDEAVWVYAARVGRPEPLWQWNTCEPCSFLVDHNLNQVLVQIFARRPLPISRSFLRKSALLILDDFKELSIPVGKVC